MLSLLVWNIGEKKYSLKENYNCNESYSTEVCQGILVLNVQLYLANGLFHDVKQDSGFIDGAVFKQSRTNGYGENGEECAYSPHSWAVIAERNPLQLSQILLLL